jgi:cyclase
VVTDDCVVAVDTPQLPTEAVAMRREAERHGRICFMVNTEHHVDHIFNYYFRGVGEIVRHQGVADNFMEVTPSLDSSDYAVEAVPTDDPEGAAILADREAYFADPGRATVTFTGDLTLTVGNHTFELMPTPGHTPGPIAVHVAEERAVFTGETIFSECPTWLMGSNVTQWLTALDRIAQRDADWVVPGPRRGVTMRYLAHQRANLLRLGVRGRRRRRPGVDAGGDRRAGEFYRPLSRRRRTGLHDRTSRRSLRGLCGTSLRKGVRCERIAAFALVREARWVGRRRCSHGHVERVPCQQRSGTYSRFVALDPVRRGLGAGYAVGGPTSVWYTPALRTCSTYPSSMRGSQRRRVFPRW